MISSSERLQLVFEGLTKPLAHQGAKVIHQGIVSSEEWCSLPMLGLPGIKPRVDSGAATSSMHAFNIDTLTRDGVLWISFEVPSLQNDRSLVVRHEALVLEQRGVRNTSGISESIDVIRE